MAVEESLPVELAIENEKLLKLEVNLQDLLQDIETRCGSYEEFERSIQEARATLTALRRSNERFSNSICEWDDEPIFEDTLRPLVGTHNTVLQSFHTNFQRSCLKGRKRVQQLEKESLLVPTADLTESNTDSKLRQRKLQKAEAATKSKDATNDLQRIARMMDSQVKHSEDSTDLLQSSSQQITKIHDEYKGLTGLIAISRKLLNKYNRREITDTLLIFFGLILFFATVIFIVSKRF